MAAGIIRVAVGHVERMNPTQVLKGRVRDGCLAAVGHVEILDPAQVHKGRICDGHLIASVSILSD